VERRAREMSVCTSVLQTELQLTADEMRCIEFLEKKQPHLLQAYIENLARARRTILHRITASLLREDVFGLFSTSYDLRVIGSTFAMNLPKLTEHWEAMIRQLQNTNLQEGILYKIYSLNERECLIIPVSKEYSFRRFEIVGDILLTGNQLKKISHSTELLHLLKQKDSSKEVSKWGPLIEELENGSANLALAYAYFEEKSKKINVSFKNTVDTLDYIQQKQNTDPSFSAMLFFEQLCVEGHHLHPGSKTKMGMLPEDVFNYAAEFEGTPSLKLVALHRDLCDYRFFDHQEPNDFFFEHFPEFKNEIREFFATKEQKLEDFVLLPVHPWQWKNIIPDVYREELKDGTLILIEKVNIPAFATTSFRTVIPKDKDICVKTAVHSQMTSTVRSISPQSANNGAEFTKLIRKVMDREKQLAQTFIPICEIGGCSFRSDDTLKNRNLSVIYRENMEQVIHNDEIAIAGTALYAQSPINRKPILIEIIERYAKTLNIKSRKESAVSFIKEYAQVALPGFLTLLFKYGIGLEGHLQNTVPVFKNGRPVKILFRDWGGVRIHRPRLQKQGLDIQFYPGSITITDDLQEVQNKVFYTVFQNQLSEIIQQISKYWNIEESLLWKPVRLQCDKVFEQSAFNQELLEHIHEDKEALYQKKIDHKALTKMRLNPEQKRYFYVSVPNPLVSV
jgi:D-ornithine---citrate ligase